MELQGLVRRFVDPNSDYVSSGIAYNSNDLFVLYQNLVYSLYRDFGKDYDISHITLS